MTAVHLGIAWVWVIFWYSRVKDSISLETDRIYFPPAGLLMFDALALVAPFEICATFLIMRRHRLPFFLQGLNLIDH